ncbi:MAG: 50S ribosomal protein L25, partial [Spirochaetia bacterium]|nr:50S ribosomal protein L25 [Spirochaetia bacterium]
MDARNLTCKTRADRGKNAAGRLRRAGFVPANIIHKGQSVPVSVPELEFTRLVSAGLRSSSLIAMDMEGGKKTSVVVKEVQRHPVSGKIIHVDFYELTAGEKVRVSIPIEATGNAIGVKEGGALEQYLRAVPIKADASTIQ